jgi:hypothetical protein
MGQSEFHQRGKNGDTTVLDVQMFYDTRPTGSSSGRDSCG